MMTGAERASAYYYRQKAKDPEAWRAKCRREHKKYMAAVRADPERLARLRTKEQRYRERNRERLHETQKRYAEKLKRTRPDVRREFHLQWHYGISVADYNALFAKQNGVCLVCQRAPGAVGRLQVDHDHTTGALRGLLCGGCNKGLGSLGDSPANLRRALAYLETYGCQS